MISRPEPARLWPIWLALAAAAALVVLWAIGPRRQTARAQTVPPAVGRPAAAGASTPTANGFADLEVLRPKAAELELDGEIATPEQNADRGELR